MLVSKAKLKSIWDKRAEEGWVSGFRSIRVGEAGRGKPGHTSGCAGLSSQSQGLESKDGGGEGWAWRKRASLLS